MDRVTEAHGEALNTTVCEVQVSGGSVVADLSLLDTATLCALIGHVVCSHHDDDLAEKLQMYCQAFVRTGIWPKPEAN